MSDPEDVNLEGTGEGTPEKKKSGGTVSGEATVDWEKRYKGLQRTYDAQVAKFASLQEQYDQLVAEVEGERQKSKGHETEKQTLATSVQQLTAERDDLNKKLATHVFTQDRMKMILSEFPDLAQFEAKGLLPTADTLENLKPLLEAFRETMGGMVGDDVRKKLLGSSPAGGSSSSNNGAGKRSKEEIYARLVQLAGSNKSEDRLEYQNLLKEWDDINKPK